MGFTITAILITSIFTNSWFMPSFFSYFNNDLEIPVTTKEVVVNRSQLLDNYFNNPQELDISAGKAAILEADSNYFLYEKNSQSVQPIASITKLMTALVTIDLNPNWDEIYEIQKDDRREGGKIHLYWGDQVTINDLFYLSLVGSANTATAALVNSLGVTEENFVTLMNSKARQLGLFSTSFADPVGLSEDNLSTAREVARLTKEALNQPEILEALDNSEYIVTTQKGAKRTISSTDLLIDEDLPGDLTLIGGKTGYIELAGYCFTAQFNNLGQPAIITVVLGSEDVFKRFQDTLILAKWAYSL